MAEIQFSPSFQKHQQVSKLEVDAGTVASALEKAFAAHPTLRGYVLDDQGAVRPHVTIFVNERTIRDRLTLTDSLSIDDRVFVFQALSGG